MALPPQPPRSLVTIVTSDALALPAPQRALLVGQLLETLEPDIQIEEWPDDDTRLAILLRCEGVVIGGHITLAASPPSSARTPWSDRALIFAIGVGTPIALWLFSLGALLLGDR